jgi:hypothetical protein
MEIIHAFERHYRRQCTSKTAATIDEGPLQDSTQMKLDVLSAMHLIAEPWGLITPTAINNCFVNRSFSIEHVISNHDTAVKLSEGVEEDWHSSQPL